MKNLEQIRAAKALGTATRTARQDVAKLPAMIITNGLLATAAFAGANASREKMNAAMDGVAQHLAHPVHGLSVLCDVTTTAKLIKVLTSEAATGLDLQRATAEALAFLAYLKQFAQKD